MTALSPHLEELESEAISIFREVVAARERPVVLFSGGKDSVVLLRLAEHAFRPAKLPFRIMHVNTGHNFPEVITFRDELVKTLREDLVVASVEEAIARGLVEEETGPRGTRNRLQSATLLDAIREHKFDVAFGGARRDEDRARSKERIVSVRDAFGQWDPKNQRPELWTLFNLGLKNGHHLRVFPISNWTELDVWSYIRAEKLALPSIYYAHERPVFLRDNMIYAVTDFLEPEPHERVFNASVRFRTVGDATCTGAVRSEARTIDAVIAEIQQSELTERGATRADDRFSEAAMEDRKREGYF